MLGFAVGLAVLPADSAPSEEVGRSSAEHIRASEPDTGGTSSSLAAAHEGKEGVLDMQAAFAGVKVGVPATTVAPPGAGPSAHDSGDVEDTDEQDWGTFVG